MSKLHSQWQRLYLPTHPADPDGPTPVPSHLPLGEHIRAMVLTATGPAAWKTLAPVWQGLQADLGLPAPAIAVNGVDGLQLWFSVSEPVSASQAATFLAMLRARYLNTPEPKGVAQWPCDAGQDASLPLALVPAKQAATPRWSAFVASDLASIFADEPWLDVPPNVDAQADILARIQTTPLVDFLQACPPTPPKGHMGEHALKLSAQPDKLLVPHAVNPDGMALTTPHTDPKRFLQAVMNDASVPMALRIEAAKALLPRDNTL